MKIDVSEILNSDGRTEKVNALIELGDVSFGGNDLHFTEPVSLSGTVKNECGEIILNLEAVSNFETLCARCGEKFKLRFSYDISEKFVKNSVPYDANVLNGGEIDLKDVVLQHLYMNLPISFICKDDCKGLCQKCGQNLNEGECSCDKGDIDPRMAALLKFKNDI